jgi:membrane protease YdiL (CAAX protease family)
MNTTILSQETTPSLRAFVKRHPLLVYLVLAFAGTWITFAPIWLSSAGLGLVPFEPPQALTIVLFALSTLTGPALAAWTVTALESGREGLGQFVRRYGQWRIGLRWYLILMLGYPLLLVFGISAALRDTAPLANLVTQWPLFFSAYLPGVLFGLLIPSLGEEPGWRGFALPRMQSAYGPLMGSLFLGTLHAVWHLPAYLVPGLIAPGSFDPTVFVANSVAIVAATFVWTWLYNSGRGSILYAMLIHSVSNASVAYAVSLSPSVPDDPWFVAKLFGLIALLVVVFTRGRLARPSAPEPEG